MRPLDCKGLLLVQGSPARLAQSAFVRESMQGALCRVQRPFNREEWDQLLIWLEDNYGPYSSELILKQGAPVWIYLEKTGERNWAMSNGLELLAVEPERGDWAAISAICGWSPVS